MLLDGLELDEEVPFKFEEEPPEPKVRENVNAGVDVIDLVAFREELEADRKRRRDGGG